MIKTLQLTPPSPKERQLHKKYGHNKNEMIRGAGCLHYPDIMLLFMNPTARNVSAHPTWQGLRAPWVGTKKVWQMLAELTLIDKAAIDYICTIRPEEWKETDVIELYTHISTKKLYITNLASCTQQDARPLPNSIFREYLPVIYDEIQTICPGKIIPFGNQVSSILLQKNISVSQYPSKEYEILNIDQKHFPVYPTYYPVGQGQRNMTKAISRITTLITKNTCKSILSN
ncbi:MAG: uracil-DNA glycosylase family protein [bacterium]